VLERDYLRRGAAEFIGTFALLFVAAGGAAYARSPTDLALANGLVIAVMVSAVGFISGGHFNPAVTLGFVVTSSILARIGVPGYTAYCASKAGLLGLVRAFAAELAPRQIQVNGICPGWVDTDMAWEGLDAMPGSREEAFELAMREVPLRRMSQPEEIAGTVAWLLSPDATGVTGQGIDHNNGAWMI
jgi:NAD(P)-dependent dehydrogenase (short-subunit alcohol dehydrogenase family)